MSIKINDKIYRNLQEQVAANTDNIRELAKGCEDYTQGSNIRINDRQISVVSQPTFSSVNANTLSSNELYIDNDSTQIYNATSADGCGFAYNNNGNLNSNIRIIQGVPELSNTSGIMSANLRVGPAGIQIQKKNSSGTVIYDLFSELGNIEDLWNYFFEDRLTVPEVRTPLLTSSTKIEVDSPMQFNEAPTSNYAPIDAGQYLVRASNDSILEGYLGKIDIDLRLYGATVQDITEYLDFSYSTYSQNRLKFLYDLGSKLSDVNNPPHGQIGFASRSRLYAFNGVSSFELLVKPTNYNEVVYELSANGNARFKLRIQKSGNNYTLYDNINIENMFITLEPIYAGRKIEEV